jgi:hypothetical protein
MERRYALALATFVSVWPALAAAEIKSKDPQKPTHTAAAGDLNACRASLVRDKRWAPLKAKIPTLANKDATAKQLRDPSKPTPQLAALVAEFKTGIQQCRQKFLGSVAHLPPGYGAAYKASFEKLDAVYASLERREMAWGEANASLREIQLEGMRTAVQALKK